MLRRVLLFGAALLAIVVCEAQAPEASAQFAAAEQAFAAGDYGEALRLFLAARAAGSTGPGTLYNIGVSEYRLGDYEAAARTFATLAGEFPDLRELAEYNRGLALKAMGRRDEARIAFARAAASADEKIAALADAQLAALGAPRGREPAWRGYFAGGVGYDDNVALVDELLLPQPDSASSALAEVLGVLTRQFSAPLRLDLSGYAVRYAEAGEFDQSAVRIALAAERRLGAWRLEAGPTLGRSTLDGDGFEESLGADLRARRALGVRASLEARFLYDDVEAGAARFSYLDGSRRQLRVALVHTAGGRFRVALDLERNDRRDPGVSPSRRRVTLDYSRRLAGAWTGDARIAQRDSDYDDASVPREERLLEASFTARRELDSGWTLAAEYRLSDNDSTVPSFSYDASRVTLGLARSF
jgi:tetratricopeptide (TPR) repeat protein